MINNLEFWGPTALCKVKRLHFFYALAGDSFDPGFLTLLESFLKTRVEDNLKETMENVQSINPGEFDYDTKIHQDFSLLNEKNKFLVRRVIGAGPTLISAAEEMLDCV